MRPSILARILSSSEGCAKPLSPGNLEYFGSINQLKPSKTVRSTSIAGILGKNKIVIICMSALRCDEIGYIFDDEENLPYIPTQSCDRHGSNPPNP